MPLQDYFPSSLAELIKQAAAIKLKIVGLSYENINVTYILTVWGQIFMSIDGSFKLWRSEPVQDVVCYDKYKDINRTMIYAITLDARVIQLDCQGRTNKIYNVKNVISVAHYNRVLSADSEKFNEILVISNTGEFFRSFWSKLESREKVRRIELPGLVVSHVSNNVTLLLQQDGGLWIYVDYLGEVKPVPDITDIVTLDNTEAYVRIDGSVYENLAITYHRYALRTDIKDVVIAQDVGVHLNLITRNGDMYLLLIGCEKANLGGKALAIAPNEDLVIRYDGRVLRRDPRFTDLVLTTIPRLNVFK